MAGTSCTLVTSGVILLLALSGDPGGEAAPSDRSGFIVQGPNFGIAGETVTLQCLLTGPHGIQPLPPSYEWKKDGKVIPGQSKINLTLNMLTTQDEGKYLCGPPGSSLHSGKGHRLRVFVRPQVNIKPSGPVVKRILGESLILICEATYAIPNVPADGYSWSYLPFPYETQRPLDGKSSILILGPLTRDDRGQYFCQARNDQQFQSTTMTGNASVIVDVVYLQNLTLTPDVEVNEGDHVTLTCEVDSHPTARLAWTVNGQEVRHVTDNLDRYFIMSAACSDSTNYTCGASNTEMPGRERNATTRVHVNCTQESVMDVSDQHYSIVPVIAAGVFVVGILTGIVLGTKYHEKFRKLCKQLKCTLTSHHTTENGVLLEVVTEPQDLQLDFDRLYEKGKVYIFPRLVSQKQETAPDVDKETWDESEPLLGRKNVLEEDPEYKVKDLLRHTFQTSMSTNKEELPNFFLHNTRLSKKENVILILDRNLGVLLIISKRTKNLAKASSLKQAVQRLLEARNKVRHKLQGLVDSEHVTAVLALPCLPFDQSDDVRNRITMLRSYPDVELLPGQDPSHYRQWVERLRTGRASKVWRSSSQGGDDPDTVYKMAASSFLTLASCDGPVESPHSSDSAQSWLLTPAQVEARDSTARLLHIWGPNGSGKTTLLVHRARQWLADGKVMVLGVGREFDDVRLDHIAKAVRKGQKKEDIGRLRVCRTYQEVRRAMKELNGLFPQVDICIVIDAPRYDKKMFQKMLSYVRENEPVVYVLSTWQKNLHEVDADLAKEADQLGWEKVQLPGCIRCTKDTVELMNLLGKEVYPPIPSYIVPPTRNIPEWRVIDHCLHPDHAYTLSRCNHCKIEMSQALPSLEQGLNCSDWVALYTVNTNVSSKYDHLHEALLYQGVPASYESNAYLRHENAPTSPASAPAPDASVSSKTPEE